MTTIRQIIINAYREGGIIQIGLTPDADQLSEGLSRLQATVRSLFGNELGDPLYDIQYGGEGLASSGSTIYDISSLVDSAHVPASARLVCGLTAPKTVYLPPAPRDGARVAVVDAAANFGTHNLTVDGNGRRIEGSASVVLDTDGATAEWFYRADLGQWKEVSNFTVSSESPFPLEFDDYLAIKLILRLNPRYLAQTAQETVEEFRRMRAQFRARYRQSVEMPMELALVIMHPYAKESYDLSNPSDRFAFGLII